MEHRVAPRAASGGLARRLGILSALAASAVIAPLLVVLLAERSSSSAHHRSEHSADVLAAAGTAERHAVEAEAATATYLITGKRRYAVQARRARGAALAETRRLVELVSDDTMQRARAEEIRRTSRSLVLDWVGRSLAGTPQVGAVDGGERLRRTLRRQYAGFIAAERLLQKRRDERAQTLHRRAWTVGIAAIVFVPAALAVVLLWIVVSVVRPVRQLHHLASRVARGEEGATGPVGERGEIAALQATFNQMSSTVRERRQAILEHAPIVIWELLGDEVTWASPYWRELSGRDDDTPTLEDVNAATHPDDRQAVDEARRAGVASGKPFEYRYRLVRPDGGIRHVWTRATPRAPVDGKRNLIGFTLDVTEDELTRAQLHHAQRLDSVGLLAGGIAHDFNNLLTAIHGYAAIALSRSKGSPELGSPLREIAAAADRAAALTRQLLAFSRKQRLQPAIVDVNAAVRDILPMLRRLIPENVALVPALADDVLRIRFDRSQLEQVIVNLVVNARDAIGEDGRIEISTADAVVERTDPRRHGEAQPGRYVCLSVSDNGSGIDQATLESIFDPFFTTKPVGEGTGLGLSTVHGIVKQSGGSVTVDTEPGRGSTFTIYLPATNAPAEPDSRAGPGDPTAERAAAALRVLVVEDTPVVRDLVVQILEAGGHEVIAARSTEQARTLLTEHPIDLVVSDLLLEDGSGTCLIGLRDRRGIEPLRIFMSGYSGHAAEESGLLDIRETFIEKPFSPRALLELVASRSRA